MEPRTLTDVTGYPYATLPNAIITGQETYLPMVNLGGNPIYIRKGKYLGQLRYIELTTEVDIFTTDQNAGISLADILGEDTPDKDEEDLKLGGGYPFRIPEHDTGDVDLSSVKNLPGMGKTTTARQ